MVQALPPLSFKHMKLSQILLQKAANERQKIVAYACKIRFLFVGEAASKSTPT